MYYKHQAGVLQQSLNYTVQQLRTKALECEQLKGQLMANTPYELREPGPHTRKYYDNKIREQELRIVELQAELAAANVPWFTKATRPPKPTTPSSLIGNCFDYLLKNAITDEEKADRTAFMYGSVNMKTTYGKTLLGLSNLHKAGDDKRPYAERCTSVCKVKPRMKKAYYVDNSLSTQHVYVYCTHRDPGDKQGHVARFHNNSEGNQLAQQYAKFLNSLEE
ncbi:hypothetical protein [Stenotrophomonas phage vB_SmeS_BUCT703]|nr:hypothetical protein [Stenotrophomonas phage vB_SmeS_BUCT703]